MYIIITDRQVSSVKRMYNECFIAYVYDTTNAVTCMEGGTSARIVFHRAVIVTMFDFLKQNNLYNFIFFIHDGTLLLHYITNVNDV